MPFDALIVNTHNRRVSLKAKFRILRSRWQTRFRPRLEAHMEKAQRRFHERAQKSQAREHSQDQDGPKMPVEKIEDFTRHLRLSSDCGPYWHNTG